MAPKRSRSRSRAVPTSALGLQPLVPMSLAQRHGVFVKAHHLYSQQFLRPKAPGEGGPGKGKGGGRMEPVGPGPAPALMAGPTGKANGKDVGKGTKGKGKQADKGKDKGKDKGQDKGNDKGKDKDKGVVGKGILPDGSLRPPEPVRPPMEPHGRPQQWGTAVYLRPKAEFARFPLRR